MILCASKFITLAQSEIPFDCFAAFIWPLFECVHVCSVLLSVIHTRVKYFELPTMDMPSCQQCTKTSFIPQLGYCAIHFS